MDRQRKRIGVLRKTEGCIFCRMMQATERQKLAATDRGLTYHRTDLGDYLICAWHEALMKHNWLDDADDRREALNRWLARYRPARF